MCRFKPLAAIVALLLAGSQASPVLLVRNAPVVNATNQVRVIDTNKCQDSSFTDQTSSASPLITDCLQIADNINKGYGNWVVAITGHHQLVQYGTCAFGVQGAGGAAVLFELASTDIIDLIHDSIQKFGRNGVVGSKGNMVCEAYIGTYGVDWGIYHD